MNDAPKAERRPYVAIFGDNEAQDFTKAVWSLLSGQELRLAGVSTIAELQEVAPDAVLILVVVQSVNDKNSELVQAIYRDPRVVADIIALTDEADMGERIKIMASGFDGTFHSSFLDYADFRQVLMNRVEKGFVALENRIQQEEYRRFKATLASSPDAFIILDEHRKIFFVSDHYKDAYPLSEHMLIRGMDVMKTFETCSAEQGVAKADPRYEPMRRFWEKLDGEAEFRMDGGRIWHIKAKMLPEGQGTIVTTTDITRYKVQQIELEKQSQALSDALEKEKEASAIQKQFINMVSHEFRTPLAIIDGNAQVLQRRGLALDEETMDKRTRTIRSAVSRLISLMEGVLSSNMLKTGKLDLAREPVDMRKLISELCEEYSDLNASHRISLYSENLPEKAMLDRKLITLVIGNLLSNAVKFSAKDPRITVTARSAEGNIVLVFEDNGIGIPENEIERIFTRYYRTANASGIPGTGIGLDLAKQLVELHGGAISVSSAVGRGSRFEIILPLIAE